MMARQRHVTAGICHSTLVVVVASCKLQVGTCSLLVSAVA